MTETQGPIESPAAADSVPPQPASTARERSHRIQRLLSLSVLGQGADVGFNSLATLLIFTCVSPAEWAYYGATLASLRIAQKVSSLGLDMAAVRALSKAHRAGDVTTQHGILQAAFLAKLSLSLVVMVVGWTTAPYVTEVWLDRSGFLPFLRLAYLGILGQQLIGLYKSWFAAQLQFGRHALLVAAAPALFLAILVAAWSAGALDLRVCAAVAVLSPVAVTCAATVLLGPRLLERFHGFRELGRLWRFSKWTYLTAVVSTLRWELGTLVLLALMSSTSAGLYDVANKAAGKISLVANSLFTVLVPWASRLRTREELLGYLHTAYRYMLLLGIGIPLTPLLAELGRPVLLAFNPEYEPALPLFVVLVISMLFTIASLPTRTVMYSVHRPEFESFVETLALLVTIVLYTVLIPPYGAMGACVAMVGQRIISATMTILFVDYKVRSNDRGWLRLDGELEGAPTPSTVRDRDWRSVERPLPTIVQVVRRLIGYGPGKSVRYARHWISETINEWRFSIESERRVDSLGVFGVTSSEFKGYSPIAYRAFRAVMERIDVRSDRDVLIDIGAGKGRVVVLAATYPLKRVIGVEVADELTGVARSNIERARRHLRCHEIELITADATSFDIPDDVTIVHVFNPFSAVVAEQVFQRLRESLVRSPRAVRVLYANPYLLAAVISRHPWLRHRSDVVYPFAEHDGPDTHRYRIYDVDLGQLD